MNLACIFNSVGTVDGENMSPLGSKGHINLILSILSIPITPPYFKHSCHDQVFTSHVDSAVATVQVNKPLAHSFDLDKVKV